MQKRKKFNVLCLMVVEKFYFVKKKIKIRTEWFYSYLLLYLQVR